MRVSSLVIGGLAAAVVALPALAANIDCTAETKDKLYVNVTGIRSAAGQVTVTLYANDPKRFLAKNGSLGIVRAPAQAGSTRVCVALPSPGRYAVAVYHDTDGDGGIDRTVIGLPSEPFALSNNPPPRMAFPKIGPSLFSTRAGENRISVRLEKGRKK